MTMCTSDCNCVCNKCCNALLPFSSINDFDMKALISCNNSVKCDSTNIPYEEYFSPTKLSKLTANLRDKDFYVVHFNVRSLAKNLNAIEEFLNDMTRLPHAIAISETKLNSNSCSNITIPHYNFLRKDSPTNAGGVGLYIKDTLKFRLRPDLSLKLSHCEDLWVQIKCKTTDIILAVIYRHPNKEILSFQEKLCSRITTLESEKLNYVISGDININTLDKNKKTIDYINALNSIGCNLAINNPTRFANNYSPSLLDHIYTNITKQNTTSGISSFQISDHLPTFFLVRHSNCYAKREKNTKDA